MIKITDIAREKLQAVLDNNPGKHLRLLIQGIG